MLSYVACGPEVAPADDQHKSLRARCLAAWLVGHSGPPESEDSIAASPHEIRETSKVRIRNFPATGVKRRDG